MKTITKIYDSYEKHSYVQLSSCNKDETHIYKAIIEAVPDENNDMMIWLDDFNFPQTEIEDIKKEIELYFKAKSINCIFKAGKRV